jgi:formylmethanofuran dehydrogenase subunit E
VNRAEAEQGFVNQHGDERTWNAQERHWHDLLMCRIEAAGQLAPHAVHCSTCGEVVYWDPAAEDERHWDGRVVCREQVL